LPGELKRNIERSLLRIFFYIRIFFLGSKDARKFLTEEESIFAKDFGNVGKMMGPTGQSKLIYGEKDG
jgi:hypothetical protein